jgi:hypothetical protein
MSARTEEVLGMLRRRYSQLTPGNGPRYVLAPEVRNQAGFGGYNGPKLRACDLMVLDTWQSGPVRLIGHEVKVSRSDWLRELKDPDKAAAFIPWVSEWWLVVGDRDIVKADELPPAWGLLAPAGSTLRAVARPKRRLRQPDIPPDILAPLLRAVQREAAAEVSRARSEPFTGFRGDVPMADLNDHTGTLG